MTENEPNNPVSGNDITSSSSGACASEGAGNDTSSNSGTTIIHHHHHGDSEGGCKKKRSFFTGPCKIGVLLSVAVTCLVLGMYGGMFTILTQTTSLSKATFDKGKGEDRVAIVPVEGIITANTSKFIRRVIRNIEKDPTIKAVVLRVDSGGGGVSPSDQIWNQIKQLKLKRKIPVVASYGGVAASGGYYVSAGTDFIFAEPSTITGSIGVMAQVMTFDKLLVDKLGITPEVLTATTSPEKDVANNLYRPWNDADRTAVRNLLDPMHKRFIDVIAEGRATKHDGSTLLSYEEVKALSTGRVFTSDEALKAKLVDGIGYLDAAITKAIELGDFKETNPPVIIYSESQTILQSFGMGQSGGVSQIDSTKIRTWMNELATPQMMYMYMPRN